MERNLLSTDFGLLIEKLVNFLESRVLPLDDGQITIRLCIKETQAINVFIFYVHQILVKMTINFENKKHLYKILYIVEFLLKNNKTILNDKSIFYLVNTQLIKLLQILALDLIIKDEVFLNYWTCLTKNKLEKSLWDQRTDLLDLDLNLYNGNSYKTIQKSWFSIKVIKAPNKNLQKIFWLFYKYLLVDGMDKENIVIKTKKIKINPNSLQKKFLKTWSNHHRYTYNQAFSIINTQPSIDLEPININDIIDTTNIKQKDIQKASRNIYYSDFELRNLLVPEEQCKHIPWILETPKAIRESAVFELKKNYKSAITNYQNGNIKSFELKFKSKRNPKWTFTVPKESVNLHQYKYGNKTKTSIGLYEGRTTHAYIQTTEEIKNINNDVTIHFDGLYHYICIPEEVQVKKSKATNWFSSCDPGERKFQTIYSPEGDEYIMIGNRASKDLYILLIQLDNLISINSKKPNRNTKLQINKLRIKIENLQKELHYKTANYLCNTYENIYIPKLTKENDIISKINRKIKTPTVRKMVVLGHCKFVERLKTKANEFTNVNIHVITEEYTSQECLNCNRLTKTTNEIYVCNFCNYRVDRDILGSTNILLKNW